MWAAALPPGRNRLESRHGKTPPAPLHERAPRRPNRRSDALNWEREWKPSWEGRSSRRGRGPGPQSRRSAPGKTPKKNGVRPRNSGSAETAAQRPSRARPGALRAPRSTVCTDSGGRPSGEARTKRRAWAPRHGKGIKWHATTHHREGNMLQTTPPRVATPHGSRGAAHHQLPVPPS